MSVIFRSLYGRVAAIFLVLLLVFSLGQALFGLRSAQEFAQESDQSLNRRLAADLAEAFQPALAGGLDPGAVGTLMSNMMTYNPRIEIYLLGADGEIVSAGDKPIVRNEIALDPLLRFLGSGADARLPILGDDPLHPDRQKPFSAAPLRMGERSGYLYLILGGEQYDSIAAMIEDSYIVRNILFFVAGAFVVIGLAGLIVFFLLTKRLRAMSLAVRAFEEGDFTQRVGEHPRDEIGQLGAAFNDMAGRVVEQMEQLRREDAMRRELVANVSHDLRSPLSSVQGYLETVLMKDAALPPAQRRKFLRIVLGNVRRLSKLVDELFELTKLEATQMKLSLEPFSLPELVQDVLMKFVPTAKSRRISLKCKLHRNLPFVVGDIAMIERVLANLIENALRHTDPGGEVRVNVDRLPASLRVKVSDTGCGIAPEHLPHVFDRFYRGDKTRSPDSGGSGIGLAIAKSILEHHETEISVESAVDRGTTFAFELPAETAEVKLAANLQ